ncbi:MAG TPA: hypothetical protein VEK07_18105 [Polyangiaceae bacterium]|nr:hypothetical protein [Polyangiaceae bacterium]
MSPVDAPGIATRHQEQGGSGVDYDPPSMRIAPNACALFNVELKAGQIGHLLPKPWRLILAPASLGESFSLRTVSSPEVH